MRPSSRRGSMAEFYPKQPTSHLQQPSIIQEIHLTCTYQLDIAYSIFNSARLFTGNLTGAGKFAAVNSALLHGGIAR